MADTNLGLLQKFGNLYGFVFFTIRELCFERTEFERTVQATLFSNVDKDK